jgi:hypothetical protein
MVFQIGPSQNPPTPFDKGGNGGFVPHSNRAVRYQRFLKRYQTLSQPGHAVNRAQVQRAFFPR